MRDKSKRPLGPKNFREVLASMPPLTWARAVVIFLVLLAFAVVISAVALAVVLWLVLTAIHDFAHLGINGVLIALDWWYIAAP